MRNNAKGFSIVELLTVMSIIVLLLSVLVPGLNMVRKYAKDLTQSSQFHDIEIGLDLFAKDHNNEYVNSSQYDNDSPPKPYCGAMKLCEAMKGQDGLGFHSKSKLYADDKTGYDEELYPEWTKGQANYSSEQKRNLRARVKYIDDDKISIAPVSHIYAKVNPFINDLKGGPAVITDVYKKHRNTQTLEKIGMPILYYRADEAKFQHDIKNPDNPQNIYNYRDNQDLLGLGLPDDSEFVHPLFKDAADPNSGEGQSFYSLTLNEKAPSIDQPYNKNSYILIAAGFDSIYGTRDDVYNFVR